MRGRGSFLLQVFVCAAFAAGSAMPGAHAAVRDRVLRDYPTERRQNLLQTARTEDLCKIDVAESQLGFRFDPDRAFAPPKSALEDRSCQYYDQKQARHAGEYVAGLPDDTGAPLKDAIESILFSHSAMCSFKMQATHAAIQATGKLHRNRQFTFREADQPFCTLPETHWKPLNAEQTCFAPKVDASSAIQCFYDQPCQMECQLGLMSATSASLYELYGKKDFSIAFDPSELTMAPWSEAETDASGKTVGRTGVEETRNVNFGSQRRRASYSFADLGRQGRHALSGMTAYIGRKESDVALLGKNYVSQANQGENIVIVSVSPRAAEALTKVSYEGDPTKTETVGEFEKDFRELRQLVRLLADNIRDPKHVRETPNSDRVQLLLAGNRQAVLNGKFRLGSPTPQKLEAYRRIRAILDKPIYQEIVVFVHDFGTVPISSVMLNLIAANPKVNYSFSLNPSNLNSEMFERYNRYYYCRCLADEESDPLVAGPKFDSCYKLENRIQGR